MWSRSPHRKDCWPSTGKCRQLRRQHRARCATSCRSPWLDVRYQRARSGSSRPASASILPSVVSDLGGHLAAGQLDLDRIKDLDAKAPALVLGLSDTIDPYREKIGGLPAEQSLDRRR